MARTREQIRRDLESEFEKLRRLVNLTEEEVALGTMSEERRDRFSAYNLACTNTLLQAVIELLIDIRDGTGGNGA